MLHQSVTSSAFGTAALSTSRNSYELAIDGLPQKSQSAGNNLSNRWRDSAQNCALPMLRAARPFALASAGALLTGLSFAKGITTPSTDKPNLGVLVPGAFLMAAGIADLGLLLNKTMGGLSFLHLGSKGLTSVLSEEIDIMQAEQAGEQTNPVTVELPNQ